MKLWQKDTTSTAQLVEQFTTGNDRDFDLLMAAYDVKGSLAHTEMLAQVGLLTEAEKEQAHKGLHEILASIEAGTFTIAPDVEDVHSQVEMLLTEKIGDAGKKIHSGRSRNDQVAVDIKLFLRDQVLLIKDKATALFNLLQQLSEQHKNILLPGYTHFQVAMPSSFGLWFGAYAEGLLDDMEMLAAAYAITNKNPLGSGAGYGSSFPLNRTLTTQLLGFSAMHHNPINAQTSRGKTEKFVAAAVSAIAATLNKLSSDLCLYLCQNFAFVSFPETLTTGSSIMPHKKNPDIFELTRAKCNRLQSMPNELALLTTNLPSGYHRDMQLTKEILFPGIDTLVSCIDMLLFALPQITIKEDILNDEKYRYIYTVEAVNELVNKGIPFREAYKIIGNDVNEGKFHYENFKASNHTHEGSMGNLQTEAIKKEFEKVLTKF
ncbi:argininosuccinate lyase [Taibaiella soli]|uniref:Argininosuccinate lyase n=1 Tax=Taibaiella soli TaxID=1649169 RepID=A0A2W2BDA4_9BACT|nr:argininosuccinate lyase [Taibaiella soli]PZF74229.1 argininosuccinate lyase [Taibaiella soli]